MKMSRRHLLQASAAGLLLPRPLLAESPGNGRRFLFVYCKGGWDTTYVFSPMGDNAEVDTESNAQAIESGGILHVDHIDRPAVRAFFSKYGKQTCILNGFEVRSIAHDKAQRLLFTGSPSTGQDDWGSILASQSESNLTMPYIHVTGPSYAANTQESVARLGSNGQLNALLEFSESARPSSDIEALEDAFVLQRAMDGNRNFDARLGKVLESLTGVESLVGAINFEGGDDLESRLETVLNCFELGVSRCGIVQYDGVDELGWDTHGGNAIQSSHYQELFGVLTDLMDDLKRRPSPNGGSLYDEVCVVVCSEMGRHPKLNNHQGKHHWTYTSAMLVGAGVAGGQVIGQYDSQFFGLRVNPWTGQLDDRGEALTDKHFGATLLALGGLDAEVYSGGVPPIEAALR
ncbi:MAG: DUF1501 domain-containing protein [Myxococcota bacterium]|nr:DUF1501 domain-containing protein [Myxococcota bacterium]